MATVLITGANRGIGLELARQFGARGDDVIGTCRRASDELSDAGVRILADVDVTDDGSVSALARAVEGERLDVLIHNAGIATVESLDDLDLDRVRRQFEVNALGPLRVTRALLPNLDRGSKVVVVTSLMGSLTDNSSGGFYGYRMSKAAVNIAAVSLARDLHGRGVAVAVLHPGMVATRLTRGRGVPPAEAAAGLIARIDELDLERSGGFWHADGRRLPW